MHDRDRDDGDAGLEQDPEGDRDERDEQHEGRQHQDGAPLVARDLLVHAHDSALRTRGS